MSISELIYFLYKGILFIYSFSYFWCKPVCIFADMDASHPWQIGFQDPATPIMEGIIYFNGFLMGFMIFIACLVGWLLYKSLSLFDESVHLNSVGFTHSTLLEVVWTIVPACILMVISIPSYNLLYSMDEVIDPNLTIKVVGHQWYWSYECSDFEITPNSNIEPIGFNYSNLKESFSLIEESSVETDSPAIQSQLKGFKDFFSYMDDKVNFENLPESVSERVSERLGKLRVMLLMNEYRKDFYTSSILVESSAPNEMANILINLKELLKESSLIKEQQELVISIFKAFIQDLRLWDGSELGGNKELIKAIKAKFDNFSFIENVEPQQENVSSLKTNSEIREISYNHEGLQREILQICSDLLKTVNKSQANFIINILDQFFKFAIIEEMERLKEITSEITNIKEILEQSADEKRPIINFDSYLIPEEDLVIPEPFGTAKAGKVFRLLEVDNRLFVPTNIHIRLLITSADVLHSWAVPSLGVKVDACPGRLNQVFLFVKREGVFYGQCSELCGVNHGFMPIVVEAVNPDKYLTWVGKRLCS